MTFIDLTESVTPTTTIRSSSRCPQEELSKTSALRASRTYYEDHSRRTEQALPEIGEQVEAASHDVEVVRKESVTAKLNRHTLSPARPKADHDDIEILREGPIRNPRRQPLPFTTLERSPEQSRTSFEMHGVMEVPLIDLDNNDTPRLPKRRRRSGQETDCLLDVPQLAGVVRGILSESVGSETSVIENGLTDLTIADNATSPGLPWSRRKKRRTDLSDGFNLGRLSPTASSHDNRSPSIVSRDDFLIDEQIAKMYPELKLGSISLRRGSTHKREPLPFKVEIKEYHNGGTTYRPGKSAELVDGTFLRIISVLKDQDGNISLSGHRLKRAESCGMLFASHLNELVWTTTTTSKEIDGNNNPSSTEVGISEARKARKITFTNATYPDFSHETFVETKYINRMDVETTGRLFCRWKWTEVLRNKKRTTDGKISRLSFHEADESARIKTIDLRDQWRGRGNSASGGSHVGSKSRPLDLAELSKFNMRQPSSSRAVRQYTFGDAFCGAGGASSGAQQAGFYLSWAYDIDEKKVKSYMSNFGRYGAECFQAACADFLALADSINWVDHLHLSFPCPGFSCANTTGPQKKREDDQAHVFGLQQHIEKLKPRSVSIEETTGLEDRWRPFLDAMINIFTSNGYSVAWEIMNCPEHGIAQMRKRLVLVAGGPGDALPPIPRPTHGPPGSGLRPFVTIRDVIDNIPQNATHHDPSKGHFEKPKPRLSWDALAKTLTCNGGSDNYHPSGHRRFTGREAACLQGFPIFHDFADNCYTEVMLQAGNAFPPVLSKKVLQECRKALEQTDKREALESGQKTLA